MIEARPGEVDGARRRATFPALHGTDRVVRRLSAITTNGVAPTMTRVFVGPAAADAAPTGYLADGTDVAEEYFVREYPSGLEWPAGAELHVVWDGGSGLRWARVEFEPLDGAG